MTADLALATPPEIDAELAEIYRARLGLSGRYLAAVEVVHAAIGDRSPRTRRTGPKYRLTDAEALEAARARIDDGEAILAGYYAHYVADTIASIPAIADASRVLEARQDELDAEYGRRPWSRFFMVAGGHIHSSTACSTCRPTTLFGWLPNLSGLSEKDAVDEHGPLLCSVCFPSAPVEWRAGPPVDDGACSGSGKDVDYDARAYRPYGTCPVCGKVVSVTRPYGRIRKHKPEEGTR